VPDTFVQIYLLFIISLCATGAIVYFTNMNNLKNNEGDAEDSENIEKKEMKKCLQHFLNL